MVEQIGWVLRGIGEGLPGLLTVCIVLLVTRAVADLFSYFFDAVQAGRVQVPFLHPETTSATRRIVAALVWVLGLGIAYPYLPGAGTQAFQGLSVMVGLMVTLGATGIVTQAMSGLLLIYARALRRGDFVQVGAVEGVVTEVGPLATKVLNLRNEEITVPNAVLIASPIHNFSKLADTQGTLVSTPVTIGYDAPWRQVHELLIEAARATPHFRTEPAPRVFQRALSDFYVEYELILSMDRPIGRVTALSALHANIQDAFNRAGVQIMSPHYLGDPPQPVVVPPERWHPSRPPLA
jgi:small-conductance mechanosensitive channel